MTIQQALDMLKSHIQDKPWFLRAGISLVYGEPDKLYVWIKYIPDSETEPLGTSCGGYNIEWITAKKIGEIKP
jgi:hypothetical protein